MKSTTLREDLRNIAIIAHVDHGKTTLVDAMLGQSGSLEHSNENVDRVMDSMDLERERGITISAKNCSMGYKGVKINILDTPGHADFGGEVERALQMVDGAILLVDASEGPLPQTRFVLSKALQADLKIVVVINKVDRQDARPEQVLNEVYDLFIDLDATDQQIEFPVLYAVGRDGTAFMKMEDERKNLRVLFDTILEEVPAPSCDLDAPFQMLVSNLGYSDYLGRLTIGRIVGGSVKRGQALVRMGRDGRPEPLKVSSLQVYQGLRFDQVDNIDGGEIAILAGVDEVEIGDTICTAESPKSLHRVAVDQPTVAMRFTVNNSPLTGTEGRYVQSRRLRERLLKETLHNVALRVIESEDADSFTVQGRGEFQMAILIETMRREGFELGVGRPEIIFKEENGTLVEPIEHLFVDCDEKYTGIVTEKLATRKGRMVNLINHGSGRVRVEFSVPSRGLIGYRGEFLTDTRGTGILNALLEGYEPHRGEIASRTTGSIVADRAGVTVPYALFHLEPRGQLCVGPGERAYQGMIVGEHNRDKDLWVNPIRMKRSGNQRSANVDEAVVLTPHRPMTLERAIDFIRPDELVEVTPKNIRMRKASLSPKGR